MEYKHVDGGLINTKNSSHVIVAVQALMHSAPFLKFLLGDDLHTKSCRSMLQCIRCQLLHIYADMCKSGIGNTTPLVLRWQGISSRMTAEKMNDASEVLLVFIDILRLQCVGTNPKFTAEDLYGHPLNYMWKFIATTKVSCPSCGLFKKVNHLNSIVLYDTVTDVSSSIMNSLFECKDEKCPQCQEHQATITTDEVAIPLCPVVHLEKCSKEFTLPFQLKLRTQKFSLKGVIVQPKGKSCIFVGICPDGLFRKFEDTRVSTISPARLFMPEFAHQSKLTLLFEESEEKMEPQTLKAGRIGKGSDVVKVVSFPDLSSLDLLSGPASEIETDTSDLNNSTCQKDASTQTNVAVAEAGIQTGAFASFELCKNNSKFQFYTGLCLEDFYALFNLIGGHEVISTLKMKYKLQTPQKLRKTKLSSEDKLYLFLLRLRRGLPLQELSEIFSVSVATVGELCYLMTRLIYLTFKGMEDDMFVTAAAQRKYKPKKMWPFKNLRVLMDGASFFIQTPSNFEQQGNTFSTYKSHNVLVFTIGIACNGATIFCSDGMEGCMSDKEVILHSGLLDKLSKGDGIMTDRGYELTAELQAIGCELFKPPSLGDRQHLTPEEEILTKAIASARIYTEHAVADIKDNRLLQGTIPLTLLPVIGDLVYIAAYLRNFNCSRIHDKSFFVKETEQKAEKKVGKKVQKNVEIDDDPDDPDAVYF